MDRSTELELIRRCQLLSEDRTTTLGDAEAVSDTDRYRSQRQFDEEVRLLHSVKPVPLVHCSELPTPDSFVATETSLGSLLVSRDAEGHARVFHNMCRHRGTPLAGGEVTFNKRITCPYHAWSYNTNGQLQSVSDEHHCFPNIDKGNNGLLQLPGIEKYGFVWACPAADGDAEQHLETDLAGVVPDLDWLGMDQLTVFEKNVKRWRANWKLLSEGGVETYHFSFAHKETIGPLFLNNTAVIEALGKHLRLVLPTKALTEVASLPEDQQRIRDCSHVLYSLFPTTALLVQHHHVDWIDFRPVSPYETEIRITTLVPAELKESKNDHWRHNHDITVEVLDEDFLLGESIQRSMNSGAMSHIQYGRNEWALRRFNDLIDQALSGSV